MEALRARQRVDLLISAKANHEDKVVTREVDDLIFEKLADDISPLEALRQRLHHHGPIRTRVCASVLAAESPLPSIETVEAELCSGRVVFLVESLLGRRFRDCESLSLLNVHPTRDGTASTQALANLSEALHIADRSLQPECINELARNLGRLALQAGKINDPANLVLPILHKCCIKPEAKPNHAPQRIILRVGIAQWSSNHYGLGAEICVLRQLRISHSATKQDTSKDERAPLDGGLIVCCSAHLKCALDQKSVQPTVTEDGDVFYDGNSAKSLSLPLQPPLLNMWCESSEATSKLLDMDPKGPAEAVRSAPERDEGSSLRSVTTSLYAWGDNQRSCLGSYCGSVVLKPTPIPMHHVPFERVRTVSCSARHTLMLTWHRRLFACGDNADGACGVHGESRIPVLTAVTWPNGDHVETKSIAAGSDVFGAHSAAISISGSLYTWGIGVATGQRSNAPVSLPREVKLAEGGIELPPLIVISAGGSFNVAFDHSGDAYSWGVWADGRLGLGPIPRINSSRTSEAKGKFALYQPCPKRISVVGDLGCVDMFRRHDQDNQLSASIPAPKWSSVACGEAHVLAISRDGQLFAWGQNSYGQLGLGPNADGALKNEVYPLPVRPFSCSRCGFSSYTEPVIATGVACGPTHSVAIDAEGNVWTWGGGLDGLPMLGHADCPSASAHVSSTTELMTKRVLDQKCRRTVFQSGGYVSPYMMDSVHWTWPRRLNFGFKIKAAACGERHTVLHTIDDGMLICGDGLATADWTEMGTENESVAASKSSTIKVDDKLREVAANAATINLPRGPNARWLREFYGMQAKQVACGGQHTFVSLSTPSVSMALGRKLLAKADEAAVYLNDRLGPNYAADAPDLMASLSDLYGVDCLIIPGGGSPVCAHLAVLAKRSKFFEELILLEQRVDGVNDVVLQLLCPDLSPMIASALIEFMYCDDLFESRSQINLHPIFLHELGTVSSKYGLPRLTKICHKLLGPTIARESALHEAEDAEIPTSTLTSDLSSMIGDASFSDVHIIAESQLICVHRCVLEVRSEYFRAMFASNMREVDGTSAVSRRFRPIEVHVPDSHISMLRLLGHVYTGVIPDGDVSLLLEDLVAADRYGFLHMKLACESSLATAISSVDEAIVALEVACSVKASLLRTSMVSYVVTHINDSSALKSLSKLLESEPELPNEVFQMLLKTHQSAMWPPTPIQLASKIDENKQSTIMNVTQVIGMLIASVISLILQRTFRSQRYAAPLINALYAIALASVFWFSSGRNLVYIGE